MIRTWVFLGMLGALAMACGESGGGSTDGSGSSGSLGSSGSSGSSGGDSEGSSGATPTTSGTGDDPFAQDPVCSRDQFWTKGNQESPHMHPGMACQTCHTTMEPPVASRFPIVGTVYPTGHEPDDCLGVDGSVEPIFVEVTTADARVVMLPVNSSGNFLYDVVNDGGAVMFPITARVVQGDKERKMFGPQATGDCNSCHTQTGSAGAPGRIVAP